MNNDIIYAKIGTYEYFEVRKMSKCDVLTLIYRQDAAKRRQPLFKFTHRSKINIFYIFALQGRLVAPIHVKYDTVEGHLGPLISAKFQSATELCQILRMVTIEIVINSTRVILYPAGVAMPSR